MSKTINGSGEAQLPIHELTDGHLYKYGITTRFSVEDKMRLIACLIEVVRDRANPQIKDLGIRGLQIIYQDTGNQPNYQSMDKLFADDILSEICDLLSSTRDEEVINTVVNHIAEQMSDMIRTNGTCPSGRVNRLINVYMILRDLKDGVHLPNKKIA